MKNKADEVFSAVLKDIVSDVQKNTAVETDETKFKRLLEYYTERFECTKNEALKIGKAAFESGKDFGSRVSELYVLYSNVYGDKQIDEVFPDNILLRRFKEAKCLVKSFNKHSVLKANKGGSATFK